MKMSRRRSPRSSSSSSSSSVSRITEDEIDDLILKLQHLLPRHSNSTSCNTRQQKKVSASKIVKETCKYLKKLHKEVDDLSERVGELLSSGAMEAIEFDAEAIRAFLLYQH
ncbi:transcription factor PRE6-like isoform X1 [Andrographis paniculata]|uniref:transcription factor PRE6-like isoform X1 n=1 Tax=Andrographis paniculata TaxID=175694 RepID=UPI0021E779E0|nr:transcription factor PRE6-like isoform X1 [Andrographis paniculata]